MLMKLFLSLLACAALVMFVLAGIAAAAEPLPGFLANHCAHCHDAETKKGGLDLTALRQELIEPRNFAQWVKIHDRVHAGEMPPKDESQPEAAERQAYVAALAASLTAAHEQRVAQQGRATQRRLNRYEYENVLRDLLSAPWLQIKDALPEDGEAHRFNKSGDALDISHVQMARYLAVAEFALRQVMANNLERPESNTIRYYTREQRSFARRMKFNAFNNRPERATFPILGLEPQPDVRSGKAPLTVGAANPAQREQEAIGVVASTYEPLEVKFDEFKAPRAGRYKLRVSTYSVWVGPGQGQKWFIPNFEEFSRGRRAEPVTIYAETPPRILRHLGNFDATPEPTVQELDVWLLEGETIRPDAARLFRSRPPAYQNPLAQRDGMPGVAYRWLEVEGPLFDQWPTAGHRLLFGDLPLKKSDGPDSAVEVVSETPHADAERLLRGFVARAYRRPVSDFEAKRFLPLIEGNLAAGSSFAEAMLVGYTAVLSSPEFLCLEEQPGRLDDYALASRLAFFLGNSAPDDELLAVAASGKLHEPAELRAQTERLLNHPRSRRFVEAFLDYWLDLRKLVATAPDSALYPDYYLDDLLTESAREETLRFFGELLHGDMPARNLVAADFAMLNERLAAHYGLPPVEGVAIRRVSLPADSQRGGLLTQASVLKVTANGTTTSPVVRGAWIMERILGQPPPPPPPSVPAVEPDIRGASTIRQQLDQHRSQETCAACHVKIDPAGFALESFDVLGGWRARYRALGEQQAEPGIGHNGQKFAYHLGLPVDASGALPEGRKFSGIREFKELLLADERQIARNLVQQLIVFATGSPVGFGDRSQVEAVLDRSRDHDYGVRRLVQEIVLSDLFLRK